MQLALQEQEVTSGLVEIGMLEITLVFTCVEFFFRTRITLIARIMLPVYTRIVAVRNKPVTRIDESDSENKFDEVDDVATLATGEAEEAVGACIEVH